jgi:glycosyltransferase involved in cell wall biosynthesis
MRIALFTDFFEPQVNGIVDAVLFQAKGLQEKGHDVCVFTLGASDKKNMYPFQIRRYPFLKVPLADDWGIAFPKGLLRDCRAFQPDILHTHSNGPIGFLAPRISRKLGIPLIGTAHTSPVPAFLIPLGINTRFTAYIFRRLNSWFYNKCTLVSAPSHMMLKELTDYGLHVPTRWISNIVQTDTFHPSSHRAQLRKSLNVHSYTVLACARLMPEKAMEVTLKSIAQLVKEGMDVEFVIIGDGPHRGTLERITKELHIEPHVRFTGYLPHTEIAKWMNAADVFSQNGPFENQSMTMLQAMACGLPVIGANGGGTPQFIKQEETGLLVTPYDSTELAVSIKRIAADAALREKIMKQALQLIQKELSPDAVLEKTLECYKEAQALVATR